MATTDWPELSGSWGRRLARFLGWAFAVVLVAIIAIAAVGAVYEAIQSDREASDHQPPGTMVEVGGHRLHAQVRGEGSPTVVFESGMGGDSYDWHFVAPQVAETTTTVTYGRAGMGWSKAGPPPRDTATIARELRALLEGLHAPPPYILVGHSIGGYHVRMFQHMYPGQVAGVVLVDASHENQWEGLPPRYSVMMGAQRLAIRGGSYFAHVGIPRLLRDGLGFVPFSGPESLPEGIRNVRAMRRVRAPYLKALADEIAEAVPSARQLQQADPTLGNLPLVVLTAGSSIATDHPLLSTWEEYQKDLTKLSKRGEQRVIDNSGHYIQFDKPDAVTQAVLDVVETARRDAAFSTSGQSGSSTKAPAAETTSPEDDPSWQPLPANP